MHWKHTVKKEVKYFVNILLDKKNTAILCEHEN